MLRYKIDVLPLRKIERKLHEIGKLLKGKAIIYFCSNQEVLRLTFHFTDDFQFRLKMFMKY